ncbi:MAG: FtsX-like permease family protein, partial [Acidobacteria bacterium]|nr:FtsX-like permease family protein [Acidobacteriota bacterium]NIM62101.1 FtsX-like permease family protein [Acidobacteriota bacterium]NIO60637.1 FtsX-like permease family protein [Acidobacteriota bacterium]NIQ29507.1 FtsX-like permease family protein [Acidobacteriota bacterium]NIQ84189.1 FtsX-like permease family protein [Acidobacteriota bacterium]
MGETDVEEVLGTLRVTVVEVLPNTGLGQFGLQPTQQDPLGVFVEVRQLQRALDLAGQINAVFLGSLSDQAQPDRWLESVLQLPDLGLGVERRETAFDLTSDEFVLRPRVDEAVARVAEALEIPTLRVQSYLANAMRAGNRLIPYSLVAAVDTTAAPGGARLQTTAGVTADVPGSREILLNTWAAADLGVAVGDTLELDYYAVGPREELIDRTVELTVSGIVAIEGLGADPTLTPEYPGIQQAEDLASWDPPFPVDLDLVREEDEDYWDRYGATPKAFLGASTGEELWATRFGHTTSARLGTAPGSTLDATMEAFRTAMLEAIPPASAGMAFRPLKAEGLTAARGATDFAMLFVSFSFFLILSAALLIGLLFGLGVERRAREIGLMLAVGYPVSKVRNGFLAEGAVLAATGSALGLAGGVGYAWLMMAGLRSLWVGAVGSSRLYLHVGALSLPIGWAVSMVVILAAIAITVRRVRKVPPPQLLAGSLATARTSRRRRITPLLAWAGLGLAVASVIYGLASGQADNPGLAFGAGAMLLISGLAFFALWCRGSRSRGMGLAANTAIAGMAARNSAWNPGRSILSVALVASACFTIVMVAASKQEFGDELRRRDSGTGGFPLIAEAEVPLHQNLDREEDRAELGFDDDALARLQGVEVIPLRSQPGDDASCLNLYQPESPRLIGVPDLLIDRGGFAFQKTLPLPEGETNPWVLLRDEIEPAVVPAFADANSAMWIL